MSCHKGNRNIGRIPKLYTKTWGSSVFGFCYGNSLNSGLIVLQEVTVEINLGMSNLHRPSFGT